MPSSSSWLNQIERSEITVSEAETIFCERDELWREQRRSLYMLARDFLKYAERFRNSKEMLDLPALLEVEELEAEFRNYFPRGKGELIEGLRQLPDAIKVGDALLRDLEAKPSGRRRR